MENRDTIKVSRVKYMPTMLEPGILYVSEEYMVAGHLCPCGCGNKVITPLGMTEWTFTETNGKPTLWPSLGNWQIPCRSHYWITDGIVKWSNKWTEKQIKEGRVREENARKAYYEKRSRRHGAFAFFQRFLNWLFRN